MTGILELPPPRRPQYQTRGNPKFFIDKGVGEGLIYSLPFGYHSTFRNKYVPFFEKVTVHRAINFQKEEGQ